MSHAAMAASWASGIFLLVGLVTGVWKYTQMTRSPEHRAPFYVDTAHRAALMYSFAALVLGHLASHTVLAPTVALVAVLVPVFFFATAIGRYVSLGMKNETDNQFHERSFSTGLGMWLLIFGEVGGVLVLLVGFRP